MLVIITEDSKSGHDFWRIIHNIVLNNSSNVEVQVARPRNHVDFGGTNTHSGGITNVKNEFNYQVNRLNSLSGNHMILLAIDNVSDQNIMTSSVVTDLIRYVLNVTRYSMNYGNVHIDFTKYYCYEEIFLSFKDLPKYLGIQNRIRDRDSRVSKIYRDIVSGLVTTRWMDYSQTMSNDNRNFLYSKYRRKYGLTRDDLRNREVLASLSLEYLTSANTDFYFKVNKKRIGRCWYTNCFYNRHALNNVASTGAQKNTSCRNCYVCENNKTASSKIGNLIKKSLFLPIGLIDIDELRKYI